MGRLRLAFAAMAVAIGKDGFAIWAALCFAEKYAKLPLISELHGLRPPAMACNR